ncbi:MAG: hypothetical protein CSA75_00495, partial [Sorangium cellulosum]
MINGGDWPGPPYASGVGVLDTNNPSDTGTGLVDAIPGASAGVCVDVHNNLITGIGYDSNGLRTGEIRVWNSSEWSPNQAQALNYDANPRILANNILSAASLSSDDKGNLFVGGGDFQNGTDLGFVALVRADKIRAVAYDPESGTLEAEPPVDEDDCTQYKTFAPDPCMNDSAMGVITGTLPGQGSVMSVIWNPTNATCNQGAGDDWWGPGVTPSLTRYLAQDYLEVCQDEADAIPDVSLTADNTVNTGIENPLDYTATNAANTVSPQTGIRSPVDKTSGSARFALNDIPPVSPLGLSFSRYYNSRNSKVGPMGVGWSHTYDRRLEPNDSGQSIYACRPNGSRILFDGTPLTNRLPGSVARLTYNEVEETYTFYDRGPESEIYDLSGRLIYLEDSNGNRKELTYQDDRLTSVSDPFGRSLSFLYNPDGYIDSITDPEDNVYQYGYTNHNLTSVTFPGETAARQYLYEDYNSDDSHDPANNNLTGVVSELSERTLSIGYDEKDRAVAYRYGDDAAGTTIEYQAGPSRNITITTDSLMNASATTRTSIMGRSRIQSTAGPSCASCGQI